MSDALAWGVWVVVVVVGFVFLEARGLRRDDDEHEPLTFYIRRLLRLHDRKQPMWWLLAGMLGWLAFHFLVDS